MQVIRELCSSAECALEVQLDIAKAFDMVGRGQLLRAARDVGYPMGALVLSLAAS